MPRRSSAASSSAKAAKAVASSFASPASTKASSSSPPTTTPSLQCSNRRSLLMSSARFLQEVEGQWPAAPSVTIHSPSIHTHSSHRADSNASSASTHSSSLPTNSRLATRGTLAYHYPLRISGRIQGQASKTNKAGVTAAHTSRDYGRPHATSASARSPHKGRDSEVLEELLVEHESVAHGVRQQSSPKSVVKSTSTEGGDDSQRSAIQKSSQLPTSTDIVHSSLAESTTNRSATRSDSGRSWQSGAHPHEKTQPTPKPRQRCVKLPDHVGPSSALLFPIASVVHPLSATSSDIESATTTTAAAAEVEAEAAAAVSFPSPPPLPSPLAAELPSPADLGALPPLERFAILAGLYSSMVQGSQAALQQLGNRTVRFKRELRARLEEVKRYEARGRQLDILVRTLSTHSAPPRQAADAHSATSTKKAGLFYSLIRKANASEKDLALRGKKAVWRKSSAGEAEAEREDRSADHEVKRAQIERLNVEAEISHHQSRIRMIRSLLPALETQVESAKARFAALRELELTLRSMRVALELAISSDKEEDECLSALSVSLKEQRSAANLLRHHETRYQRIIECEDHLNVAFIAAGKLSEVMSNIRAAAEGVSQGKKGEKVSKSDGKQNRDGFDCKEVARLRAQWSEAWKCVYRSLTRIRSSLGSLVSGHEADTPSSSANTNAREKAVKSLSTFPRSPGMAPVTSSITWGVMPRSESKKQTIESNGGNGGPTEITPAISPSSASHVSESVSCTAQSALNASDRAVQRTQSNSSMTSVASFQTAQSSVTPPTMAAETTVRHQLPTKRSKDVKDETLCGSHLFSALGQISFLLTTLGLLLAPRLLATPLILSTEALNRYATSMDALTTGLEKLRGLWDEVISLYEETGEELAKRLVERLKEGDQKKSEWWACQGERAVSGLAM